MKRHEAAMKFEKKKKKIDDDPSDSSFFLAQHTFSSYLVQKPPQSLTV
jgi:hypothetical protein